MLLASTPLTILYRITTARSLTPVWLSGKEYWEDIIKGVF